MRKKNAKATGRQVIKTKGHGDIIVEPWYPQPKAKAKVAPKRLNVEMADRHLRAIEKWVKSGHITEAQAAALRSETIQRVVGQ
jgi:hypothetical protein